MEIQSVNNIQSITSLEPKALHKLRHSAHIYGMRQIILKRNESAFTWTMHEKSVVTIYS